MSLSPNQCHINLCDNKSLSRCYHCSIHFCAEHYDQHNKKITEEVLAIKEHIHELTSKIIQLTNERETSEKFKTNYRRQLARIRDALDDITLHAYVTAQRLEQLTRILEVVEKRLEDYAKSAINSFSLQTLEEPTKLYPIGAAYNYCCLATDGLNLLVDLTPSTLCLFDEKLRSLEVLWTNGQVTDMCYSQLLGFFILLTSEKVFTLDSLTITVREIVSIRPYKRYRYFNCCTCSHDTLFLAYGSSVELYNLNTFALSKRWKTHHIGLHKETIGDLCYQNDDRLGILICGHRGNRFEVRNSQTLMIHWKIAIDSADCKLCSLPNCEWLVTSCWRFWNSFEQVTNDGKLKSKLTRQDEYKYGRAKTAVVYGERLLAIRTLESLNLHLLH
ncbi:unnamed protein product [Didymodactylos carnosus]|uniref:Uncharacterized protein n=1 Tax=Didymodactylos carnosus TaxID=1234261 RepID=A0A813UJ33_9BILA|nr:unnamed protein product [Didymodactylos carnosus]CAF3610619.1 unnamed protein product [Didymodactylos carnosus]